MFAFSSPSPSRYGPSMSSPLAMPPSSPILAAQANRRGQYKARSVSYSSKSTARNARRVSTNDSSPEKLETTATKLMRGRLIAKCEQQRAFDRKQRRARSFDGSSDYDGSSDSEMATEYEYEFLGDDSYQNEFVGRIMATEARRAHHRLARSFEFEVGSSPGVPEDELEEFGFEQPPEEDSDFAALFEEYERDMRALDVGECSAEAPEVDGDDDASMSDDFDAPITPKKQVIRRRFTAMPRIVQVLERCPGCQTQRPLHELAGASHTCSSCQLTVPTAAVSSSWHEEHGAAHPEHHRPGAMQLPDGTVLLCAAEGCDWCFDL
ncbi:hypothetical protein BKA62DRAFT_693969 [Auriculariales sp. MPI-PUGE-AT-0066]|nr:hypothetical protein BKA62DRAFT_693969 [Auriculariales sp. MPI-PUGE-AT-0066]